VDRVTFLLPEVVFKDTNTHIVRVEHLNMLTRKPILRSALRLALVIFLASTLFSQDKRAGREVMYNDGTLHEAAIASGGTYVTSDSRHPSVGPQRLKDLAKASALVVSGMAVDNVGRISERGRSIVSVYTFRVEQSHKGNSRPGDTISVVLPGGRVSFADGTMAQVNTPNFPKMKNGERYVLFLVTLGSQKSDNGEPQADEFYPTSGEIGVFALEGDGRLVPFANPKFHPISRLRGMFHDVFLLRVEKAVRESEERGPASPNHNEKSQQQ
jgi:hypothetical protein